MRVPVWILAACVPVVATLAARAGDVPRREVPRPAEAREIRIDGRMDEPAWSRAAVLPLPWETFPGENLPAEVQTEVLILEDGERLLVGFRVADPQPELIRAHYTDRDLAFRDDLAGFILDTFGDGRSGFLFAVNPFGVQMDAVAAGIGSSGGGYPSLSGAPGEDYQWDTLWDAAGTITASGWEVEIAVPWESLRFPETTGPHEFRFAPFRSWPRVDRVRFSAVPLDRDDTCFLCQAPVLTGFSGIRPGRGLEFDPTLTWSRTDTASADGPGRLDRGDGRAEAGLTVQYALTDGLRLSATFNPDFSQVEADAAQLEINRRFTLFFPEKRPFFLEGAEVFGFPARLVYTRQVADPRWGLKLAGREGAHTVGVFLADDRGGRLIFPRNDSSSSASLDVDSVENVALRWRWDFGRSSNVGAMVTDRSATGYANRVLGADGRIAFNDTDSLSFSAARSITRYPDLIAADNAQPTGRFEGSLLSVSCRRDSREWDYGASWAARSPAFRADLGFLTRVDFRSTNAFVERTWWGGEDDWFDRLRLSLSAGREEDFGGELTARRLRVGGTWNGPLQSLVIVRVERGLQRFGDALFDADRIRLFTNVRPTGDFTSSLRVSWGDAIDVAGARQARTWIVSPGITWNLGPHFFVQLDETWQSLSVAGRQLFRARVSQARIVHQFNLRQFVRAIVQFSTVRRATERYVGCPPDCPEARSSDLFVQLLYSYKLNARTLVFAGVTEGRSATEEFGLEPTSRSWFLKLAYAFVP